MTSTDDEPRCHYLKKLRSPLLVEMEQGKSSHMRLRLCPNREQLSGRDSEADS